MEQKPKTRVQDARRLTVYLDPRTDAGLRALAAGLSRSQTWLLNRAISYAIAKVLKKNGTVDGAVADEMGMR